MVEKQEKKAPYEVAVKSLPVAIHCKSMAEVLRYYLKVQNVVVNGSF